jgi:NADH dehydrogenase
MSAGPSRRPRVLILGAGFAGLSAAQVLRKAPVDVLLIDRRNYHLFQPLLYQVATASLSPAEIAAPIRKVLRDQKNAVVILDEATSIDLAANRVSFENKVDFEYDYLLVATGATHSYFGKDEWSKLAPGLKTVEDATEVRKRFLLAFEQAELEADIDARTRALTFVIVGGGPTGVELAGAIAEIAHGTIPRDFRRVDTKTARIVLIEGQPRLLAAFPEAASKKAETQLKSLGVEIMTASRVTHIDEQGVNVGDRRIESNTVFWAAGVRGSPIGKTLGVELDKAGRVTVGPDLTPAGHPNVFIMGDLAAAKTAEGGPVPGVAPAAMQMGRYVGRIVHDETTARSLRRPVPPRPPFVYKDKGSMAVIGRNKAVAVVGSRVFGGFFAWILWAFVHVLYLVTFKNRLLVTFNWFWSYLFLDRGARLITGEGDVKLTRPWTPERLFADRPVEEKKG